MDVSLLDLSDLLSVSFFLAINIIALRVFLCYILTWTEGNTMPIYGKKNQPNQNLN